MIIDRLLLLLLSMGIYANTPSCLHIYVYGHYTQDGTSNIPTKHISTAQLKTSHQPPNTIFSHQIQTG